MTRLWCIQRIPTTFSFWDISGRHRYFRVPSEAEVNVTQLSSINHHGETIPVEAVV